MVFAPRQLDDAIEYRPMSALAGENSFLPTRRSVMSSARSAAEKCGPPSGSANDAARPPERRAAATRRYSEYWVRSPSIRFTTVRTPGPSTVCEVTRDFPRGRRACTLTPLSSDQVLTSRSGSFLYRRHPRLLLPDRLRAAGPFGPAAVLA